MNQHLVRSIVIVGGGTAGWMTAAALVEASCSRAAGSRWSSPTRSASSASARRRSRRSRSFNAMLGHRRGRFPPRDPGTFKLGIEFVDWARLGDATSIRSAPIGQDLRLGHPFHQLWLRLQRQGKAAPGLRRLFAGLRSAAAQASSAPRSTDAAQLAAVDIDYAFHFDASLYARFLRAAAPRRAA